MVIKKMKNRKMPVTLALFLLLLLVSAVQVSAEESRVVNKVNTAAKVIALTFDDGDDGANIPQILQILAENNIKGTFFTTGLAAESHPELIRSIAAQGNSLGNHSFSHPYFTKLSSGQIKDELLRTDTVVNNISGQSTKPYFRPPYGDYNSAVLQAAGEAGFTNAITWSIDSLDWQGVRASEITQKVLSNAFPGCIVLMHTGSGAVYTPAALPGIISSLKAMGYKIVTIPQLLTYTASAESRYVVKAGDTLWKIAAIYKVTVPQLVTANKIVNPNLIYIGQVIIIPGQSGATPEPVIPSAGSRYIVKAGDTLWKIATFYKVTVPQLVTANKIANPNLIYPNQVLIIP